MTYKLQVHKEEWARVLRTRRLYNRRGPGTSKTAGAQVFSDHFATQDKMLSDESPCKATGARSSTVKPNMVDRMDNCLSTP